MNEDTVPMLLCSVVVLTHTSCSLSSLLSQYRFCTAGVGLGAAYGIRSKTGIMPMVAGGVAGTLADLVYGYTVACVDEVEQYRKLPHDKS